jgi:DNA-directed RNA polymerase I subunit RPA43
VFFCLKFYHLGRCQGNGALLLAHDVVSDVEDDDNDGGEAMAADAGAADVNDDDDDDVDAAADADASGVNESSGFIFPVARVKKIMRIDGDIKKVTVDAVRAMAAALEIFLKQTVVGTGQVTLSSGHKQIHDAHFRQFTMNHEEYDFLPDCLPPPLRAPKAASSKARSSAISAASHPVVNVGSGKGVGGSRGKSSSDAAAPIAGGKQTVLTFGRQQQQQQQQQQQDRFDISSGDEGSGRPAADDVA